MLIPIMLEIPRINWADNMSLPADVPVREILERFIVALPENLQKRTDYLYDLVLTRESKMVKLALDGTLQDQGVKNGDRLLLIVDLKVAGANLDRLRNEYKEILGRFVCHPFIEIKVLRGNPPVEYEVTYKVRGFVGRPDSDGLPPIGTRHVVQFTLHSNHPLAQPTIQMKTVTFHPNISRTGTVCVGQIGRRWDQRHWIWRDAIVQTGRMLQYQVWDVTSSFDGEAKDFVVRQELLGRFPLDTVDLEMAPHS